MNRWIKWSLVGCAAACLVIAVGLGLLVWAFGSSNPMLLAFLVSFEVRNDSGLPVRITPIGMWEGSGKYGPLPRYHNQHPPALPSEERFEIPIRPGETVRITYDCDDINFRHLLVRIPGEVLRIVDTDRMGTRRAVYGPQAKVYAIPPVNALGLAPQELEPCTRGIAVRYSGAVEYP